MAKYGVGYLVGSLSSTSINLLLSKALAQLAPPELELTERKYVREFLGFVAAADDALAAIRKTRSAP